jgi:hypothetical protein
VISVPEVGVIGIMVFGMLVSVEGIGRLLPQAESKEHVINPKARKE